MSQIDEDLFNASKTGSLKKAKRAIEMGADVNAKSNGGETPLLDMRQSFRYC
jgi:hypothetical protein